MGSEWRHENEVPFGFDEKIKRSKGKSAKLRNSLKGNMHIIFVSFNVSLSHFFLRLICTCIKKKKEETTTSSTGTMLGAFFFFTALTIACIVTQGVVAQENENDRPTSQPTAVPTHAKRTREPTTRRTRVPTFFTFSPRPTESIPTLLPTTEFRTPTPPPSIITVPSQQPIQKQTRQPISQPQPSPTPLPNIIATPSQQPIQKQTRQPVSQPQPSTNQPV